MNIDFIIPSYHSKGLTSLCIRSFEKYKNNFEFRYIVVENASDESYKDEILSLSENVVILRLQHTQRRLKLVWNMYSRI